MWSDTFVVLICISLIISGVKHLFMSFCFVLFCFFGCLYAEELMLLNCDFGEESWESLGLQGGPASPFWRSLAGFLWREWCWSWNSSTLSAHAKSWLTGKDFDAGRDWGQEEKGATEDEMAGWHHRLDGRESEWTLRVGDGQGGLACCDSWGRKQPDTTERLNWQARETLKS